MIAVDTLVHNLLVRTGILHRLHGTHPYGPSCSVGLCRHHRAGRRSDRCSRVQSGISRNFPTVRSARHLVLLRSTGDSFTLRYRDHPELPKFVRPRSAIALMSPPSS